MIFCLTSVHLKMLIPRGLMLVVFIFLKDSTSATSTTAPTTQPAMNINTTIILSSVIPLLVVLCIAGFLIWCYIHSRSKGFNFPRLQKCFKGSPSEMNATQPDIHQHCICDPQATNCSTEQVSSSYSSPTYRVNDALYSHQNYENVTIGPISQTEENVKKYESPTEPQQHKASQSMNYDDHFYENHPSVNDSAVYCNYKGHHDDEEDDIYIIPSE